METIFFGNGINRLLGGFPSWNKVLDSIAGENAIRTGVPNNIIEYEGIIANKYKQGPLRDVFGEEYRPGTILEEELKEKMRNIILDMDKAGECSQDRIYQLLAELKPDHFITTNYDNYLLEAYKSKGYNVGIYGDKRRREKIYSIRRRYTISSEKDAKVISYWPIHGEIPNVRSMMFGLDHYCGSIGKIGGYLKGGYEEKDIGLLKRLREAKTLEELEIKSWIDLFFLSNIHIVGFSFGYDEIDLWWILNRRYRLYMENNNLIKNKIVYYGRPSMQGQADIFKALMVEVREPDFYPAYEEYFEEIRGDKFKNDYSDSIDACPLIDTVLNNAHSAFSSQSEVCLVDELKNDDWSRLKNDVKYVNRYMLDISEYRLDHYIGGPNNEIKEGSILYRARINECGVSKYSRKKMGCPPKELCTPGRANPQGIPYTYLSEDRETTMYEVRATLLDNISVGKFRTVSRLKIFDFDLDFNLDLFEVFNTSLDSDLKEAARQKIFFDNLTEDMSKPLHRNDSILEYVPTQLVCEFCRVNDIDGIRYRSAMHKGGTNVVVFNQDAIKCVSVEVCNIEDLKLKAVKV